jgi:hypothetical protein
VATRIAVGTRTGAATREMQERWGHSIGVRRLPLWPAAGWWGPWTREAERRRWAAPEKGDRPVAATRARKRGKSGS